MIGCENPDCTIEWFHFGCVGITEEVRKQHIYWECELHWTNAMLGAHCCCSRKNRGTARCAERTHERLKSAFYL
jgi:hypothetical protein